MGMSKSGIFHIRYIQNLFFFIAVHISYVYIYIILVYWTGACKFCTTSCPQNGGLFESSPSPEHLTLPVGETLDHLKGEKGQDLRYFEKHQDAMRSNSL